MMRERDTFKHGNICIPTSFMYLLISNSIFSLTFQYVSMQLPRTQIDEKIIGVNLSAFVMTTMTFLKTTLIPAVL